MIELKEEVNRLLVAGGYAPRYASHRLREEMGLEPDPAPSR